MPKGGARTRSGPAPDPDALRRERDDGEWIELPKAGRSGPPPVWPLTKPTADESRLWAEVWSLPQAIVWERQRQELEVATYVRRFVEGTVRGATTAAGTLVRQLADSLGLTTPGLRSHRWKIVDSAVEAAPRRFESAASARLRVVDGV